MGKTQKNKLFGTDGIRSVSGEYPLDQESVIKLGHVLGRLFKGARIAAGRDTRESGPMLLSQLAAGMNNNIRLTDCGVVPTPGLSFICEHGSFDYGMMITASHNPWTDNGIKLFNGDGEKLPDELEEELEEMFFSLPLGAERAASHSAESLTVPDHGADSDVFPALHPYLEELESLAKEISLSVPPGFRIIVDCAEGATYRTAPWVFRRTGIVMDVIHDRPDGRNINRGCGSTHLESVSRKVREQNADLGVAFDGDGDRVLMIDCRGRTLDGDHVLYAIARYLRETGDADAHTVVGTVMSNLGLEKALEKLQFRFIRTDVGDRHVYRAMKESNAAVGGEQSGHTILRRFRRSGDGVLTALYFLKALFRLKLSPENLYDELTLFPQFMKSINVREKRPLEQWPELQRLEADFRIRFGDAARVLIRYSGTEPKIRLMLEAREQEIIDSQFALFENLITSALG